MENALEEVGDGDLVMHLLEDRVRDRRAERRDGWEWRREGILEVDWRFRFRWECCAEKWLLLNCLEEGAVGALDKFPCLEA